MRWFSLLLALVLLTGCGKQPPDFVWQVDALPANLDPQAAETSADLLAVEQLYRGLFLLDSHGQPRPDCCASVFVSGGGLVWRFALRPGCVWWDGTPVRAEDFAFGLQRTLDPATGSPDREALSAIAAVGWEEDVLVVTLSRPEPNLPRLLCRAGAMPCRKDFFEASGGSYGLTAETTLGNGAFALRRWGELSFTLGRVQGTGIPTLRLAAPESGLSPSAVLAADPEGVSSVTWALVLNPQVPCFGSTEIPQAIGAALYGQPLTEGTPLSPANQLLPLCFGEEPCLPEFGEAAPLFRQGLARLGLHSLQGLTLLCPDDPAMAPLVSALKQLLQRELGLFCSVRALPTRELCALVEQGDYQLALYPCRPSSPEVEEFLRFCAALVDSEAETQEQLLAEGYIIPLAHQALRLTAAQPMAGLWFSPYTGRPCFRWTEYRENDGK